ncbi:pyrroloquinoline quinone-dependent dehydrogenase [Tunturibacter psychrotolerans]|uniref:Pyrroloquinoline quinone-dependent dehydrogenase n=1 Tax=Tunturiibacter psychrotolerans TaxID=3069686 RepID=A0AAU7ZUL3_9BACT
MFEHNDQKSRQGLTRREVIRLGAVAAAMPMLGDIAALCQVPAAARASGEWRQYAGDKASTKYSSLNQITADNFSNLKVAWTWRSVEEDLTQAHNLKTWAWEATPLMIDGVLYLTTSLSQAVALDAATGKLLWVYDPETWKNGVPSNNGFVHRGVSYWADGDDTRIVYGTGDGYLICIHAKTGKPVETFGDKGRIDLTQGLGRPVERKLYGVSSPPVICRDVIVMGSKVNDVPLAGRMPPGDVRGFDVRTGKLVWTFHTIPHTGEYGYGTWINGSAETTGSANLWSMLSADDELGYVYLPLTSPSDDHYGVNRPGSGLFGECLVCVEATTGKRVWHFQMAHHGLWDYDLPAAPNLIDIHINGRRVKAVAQTSKEGFLYVFDRGTGKPIWPITEQPVPQSTIPGEQTSPTQPFPTKPAAFDRQGVTEADLTDFTPELHAKALAELQKYNYGPLFTPESLQKPTIELPGIAGGASWSGAACDPETGMCYVSSVTFPYTAELVPSSVPHTGYIGKMKPVPDIDGVPLWKPPYGRVTAIDLNTGDHSWMTPVGDLADEVPALKQLGLKNLGRPARGHLLLTKTVLIIGQEGTTQREGGSPSDVPKFKVVTPNLVAFDKALGKRGGEVALPHNATAAPMTYMLSGKQFIVVATGGANLPAELIAFTL